MLYHQLTALDPKDPALTLTRQDNWRFAAELTHIPLALAEAEALVQDYVLLFSSDSPTQLIALLGVDGRNRYLDAAHQWQAQHIPALLRLYPFALIPGPERGQSILVYDAQAPHVQGDDGQPLSDDQGRPGQLLQQATAQLVEYQRGVLEAQALIAQLEQAGLIDDQRRLDVELKDGTYRSFAGFKAGVPERLETLEAETRSALTASGALKLLHWHQVSLNNMARLVD